MREFSHPSKIISCIMIGIVVTILAGCSGEPSASDVEKAVKDSYFGPQYAQIQYEIDTLNKTGQPRNILRTLGGQILSPQSVIDAQLKEEKKQLQAAQDAIDVAKNTTQVKKLDCAQAQSDPAYRCNVEVVDTKSGLKDTRTVRLVKGSNGWVIQDK